MLGVYIVVGLCVVTFAWASVVVYNYIKIDLDFSDLVKEETVINRRHQRAIQNRQRNTRRVQFDNVYNSDDVFNDIPGDSGNVQLNIPDEVCDEVGLSPGDSVDITQVGNSIVITKTKD
jgi:hypothetical protein